MKKSLLLIASIVVAAVVSFVVVKVVSAQKPNELFYENVEVLADGESSGVDVCYNSITTAEGQFVRYCGDCQVHPGKPAIFSGKGKC